MSSPKHPLNDSDGELGSDESESGSEEDSEVAVSQSSSSQQRSGWFGALSNIGAKIGSSLLSGSQKVIVSPFRTGDTVINYVADLLEDDALAKFNSGFKFRPIEPLLFPFGCHLVSRADLIEGVGFVTQNFLCFLGNVENGEVDDAGRPLVPLRVIIPLRSVLRIDLEMCVVRVIICPPFLGVYNEGEPIDAMLMCTANAKHQLVWIDEFERASASLSSAWEAARKPERLDEALPVSLVLNPEFASSEASAETSPRRQSSSGNKGNSSTTKEPSQYDASLEDGDSAVSEDYDSEHKASVKALNRKPLPLERPVAVNTPVVVDVAAAVKLAAPNNVVARNDTLASGAAGASTSEWVSLIDDAKK